MEAERRDEGIRGDENMAPRHQCPERTIGQRTEEPVKTCQFIFRQHREARYGCPFRAVEGGWNPPDPAFAAPLLGELRSAVFDQPVGRIGDDCMNTVLRQFRQPMDRIIKHHEAPGR